MNDKKRERQFEIDRLASAFKQQWLNGQQPSIANFLQELPCEELLIKLVMLDIEMFADTGRRRLPADYATEFPEYAASIKNFFASKSDWLASFEIKSGVGAGALPSVPVDHGKEATTAFPQRIGKFEILSKVSGGGMGDIYRARQTSPERIVALKTIRSDRLTDKAKLRFQNEANAVARLDHPNIVPVFEAGQADGVHYLTMPLIEGHNLEELCHDVPVASKEAARYIYDVARAVAFAHNAGVIHRDIKAANILIDKEKTVRVTDFGVARIENLDQSLTKHGDPLGTPSYMSPEQASGNTDQIDEVSDVYSIGATLYQLLTCRPPFQGASLSDTLRMVQEQEVVPPSRLTGGIAKDLETICLKCLQKERTKRYASATELAEDLNRFLHDQPILARPISWLEKTIRLARRKPAVAAAIAAGVGLLIAAIVSFGLYQKVLASRMIALERDDANLLLSETQTAILENRAIQSISAAKFSDAKSHLELVPRSQRSIDWQLIHASLDNSLRKIRFPRMNYWGFVSGDLSADGKRLVAAGNCGEILLWDLENRVLIKTLVPPRSVLKAFEKFETRIEVPYAVPLERVGVTEQELTDKGRFYSDVAFIDESRVIAVATSGDIVLLSDKSAASTDIVQIDSSLLRVAVAPSRQFAFVADDRKKLHRVDLNKLILAEDREFSGNITAISFFPGQDHCCVGLDNGEILVLDEQLNMVASIDSTVGPVQQFQFLDGSEADTVDVFFAAEKVGRCSFNLAENKFDSVKRYQSEANTEFHAVAVDQQRVCAVNSKGELVVWHPGSDKIVRREQLMNPAVFYRFNDFGPPADRVATLFLDPERTELYAVSQAGLVGFDVAELSQREVVHTGLLGDLSSFCFVNGVRDRVVSVSHSGEVVLLDVVSGKSLARLELSGDDVQDGKFVVVPLADNRILAGGANHRITQLQVTDSTIAAERTIFEHTQAIAGFDYDANHNRLATVDADATLILFDCQAGRTLAELRMEGASQSGLVPGHVRFSSDGKYLAAFGNGQSLRLIETSSQEPVPLLVPPQGVMGTALGWNPKHNTLIYCDDYPIRHFKFLDQAKLDLNYPGKMLQQQLAWVRTMDITASPDGQRNLMLNTNGEVEFWSADHQIEICRLESGVTNPTDIELSPDGRWMAVASAGGDLKVFRIEQSTQEIAVETARLVAKPIVALDDHIDIRFVTRPNYHEKYGWNFLILKAAHGGAIERHLYWFRTIDGRAEFEVVDSQPADKPGDVFGVLSQLAFTADGKPLVAYRRVTEGYDGRLVLAKRDHKGNWTEEVVVPEGNAGHFAAMFNIDAENANSILHFDYDGYHLMRSDRIEGQWVTRMFQQGWSPLTAGTLPGMSVIPCRSQTPSLYRCVGGTLSIHGEQAIFEPDSRQTGLYYERSLDGRMFRLIGNQIQVKCDEQWERVTTLPVEFDDQAVFGVGASNVFAVGTHRVFFAEQMGDRIRLHEFDGQNWRAEDWHLGDWNYAFLNVTADDQPMLHVLETKTSSGFSSLQVYSRE